MKSTLVFVFLAIQMIASQEVTPTPSPATPPSTQKPTDVTIVDPETATTTNSPPTPTPTPETATTVITSLTQPPTTPTPETTTTVVSPSTTPTPETPTTVVSPSTTPTPKTPTTVVSPSTTPTPETPTTVVGPPTQPLTTPTTVVTPQTQPSTTTPKPQLTTLYILYDLIHTSLINNRVDSRCVRALPDKTMADQIQSTIELCMYEGRQPDRRLVAKLAWEEEKHRQDMRGIYSEFIGLQRWIHESAENVRFGAVRAAIMAEMVRSRLDTERVERITKECARKRLQGELEASNVDLSPIRNCLDDKIF